MGFLTAKKVPFDKIKIIIFSIGSVKFLKKN